MTVTIEPLADAYEKHLITVERQDGVSVQRLRLTERELAVFLALVAGYDGTMPQQLGDADTTGRPIHVHGEHGRFGVVS